MPDPTPDESVSPPDHPFPEPEEIPVHVPAEEPAMEIIVNLPAHNPDPRTWRRVPEMVLNEDGWPTQTGKMLTVDEAGTLVPLM